jgi:hypothetical protein
LILIDIQHFLYDGDKLGSTYSFWRDIDDAPRRLELAFLTSTKSRIPGDEEHFWTLKPKPEHGRADLEVFLGNSKKPKHGVR